MDEKLKNSLLYEFLGTDGMAELRSKVIDVIIEDIRNGFQESDTYIFSPYDVGEELYDTIKDKIIAEVIDEYKEKVRANIEKRMDMMLMGTFKDKETES